MRRPDEEARTVLASYGRSGARARLHTALRWASCPFELVEALVPEQARVLDLGCGHGAFSLYLARRAPGRQVVGVDIDSAKIALGVAAAGRVGLDDRVTFDVVSTAWRPDPETFDAVVVADVLYLLGRPAASELLADVADSLRPGGRVVVKEMGAAPRWKRGLNEVQERLATRVLRITAGDTVDVLAPDDIVGPLRSSGLDVSRHPMDRGYLHPHLTIVGTRPS